VTTSQTGRLRSRLSRLEDQFPGCHAEIVGGTIVLVPLQPFHGRTIGSVVHGLAAQLGPEWACMSDVAFPFTDVDELCPDVAVVPRSEADRNLSAYSPDLIELAVEAAPAASATTTSSRTGCTRSVGSRTT